MNFREILLGPSYFYHRNLIRRSHSWSKDEIDSYLNKRKKGLEYSLYERKAFSKEYYRKNLSKFEKRWSRFLTKKVTTGGTSASPFEFQMDLFFRRQKERAYLFDMWKKVGYRPFDLRVIFRGIFSDQLIRYDFFENSYVISPSQLIKENKKRLYSFLRSLNAFFLHVYPSSLFSLINFLGKDEFASLNVKGILAGSESFPIEQMKMVENDFDLKIAYWYGHSEYAVLAMYCDKCDGFHFYPTYGLVDFNHIKDNICEILATSYNSVGTRFIRYQTEDLAVTSDIECEYCNFKRVDNILGRKQDFIVDKFGYIQAFGPFLFGIHNKFWGSIKEIQFVQRKAGSLLVLIVIKDESCKKLVEDFLKNRFLVVDLEFRYVHDIKKTLSGKHRYFISEIG